MKYVRIELKIQGFDLFVCFSYSAGDWQIEQKASAPVAQRYSGKKNIYTMESQSLGSSKVNPVIPQGFRFPWKVKQSH